MRKPVTLNFNGMQYAVFKHEQKRIRHDNLKTITEYDLQNKRKGLTETTRYNNIQFMLKVAKHFQKPFKAITRDELTKYVDDGPVKDTSKGQYVIHLKKFYKWLTGEDEPDVVKALVKPKSKRPKKKFSEMWTEEEVQKLIDSYPEPQRKALVATLYDSGCRIGELVGLKRKDVVCNNGVWSFSVNGKTGNRPVPLSLSTRYFEPWFNQYHPDKTNPEAPLFISMSPRTMYKPMEPLIGDIDNPNPETVKNNVLGSLYFGIVK